MLRLSHARTLAVEPFSTPWGRLALAAADDVLLLCDWFSNPHLKAHAAALEAALAEAAGEPGRRQAALFAQSLLAGETQRFSFSDDCAEAPEQAAACLAVLTDWLSAYAADPQAPLPALTLGLIGTEKQRRTWTALLSIPPGATASYGEFARRAGLGRSSRAVGQAVGRNPFSILLPCHRVIGAQGALTGYAGGVDAKRALLAHEGGPCRSGAGA